MTLLVIVVLTALVAGIPYLWRRDLTALRTAETRNQRLTRQLDAQTDRAETAEASVRDWMAHADGLAADLENHQHVCLGTLTHQNDGVRSD